MCPPVVLMRKTNRSPHILNLKRLTINERLITYIRSYRKSAISILSFAFVLIVWAGFSYRAGADVAYFYPTTCLGDWQNPERATGGRSLEDDAVSEDFTIENSTVLASSSGRIYCGSFEGTLPEGAISEDISVGLSFVYKTPEIKIEVNAEAVTETGALDPEFTATSIDSEKATTTLDVVPEVLSESVEVEVLEPPPEADQPLAEEIIQDVTEEKVEEIIIEEPVPELEPALDPEPVSWLLWGTRVVYAQEQIVEPEPEITTSTPEIITEVIPEITAEVLSEIVIDDSATTTEEIDATEISEIASTTDEIMGEVMGEATSTATTSEEVIISGEVAPISEPEQNGVAEILYTLDGENWISIGTINSTDEGPITFHLSSVDVADLSRMQVSIQAVGDSKDMPNIYLDSMWLEVSYTIPPPPEPYQVPSPPRERPIFRSADFILFDSLDELKDVYQGTDPSIQCEVTPFSQEVDAGISSKLDFKLRLPSDSISPFRIRFGDLPNNMSVTDMGESFIDIASSSGRSFNFSVSINSEVQIGQSGMIIMYDTSNLSGSETRTVQCQFSIRVK